MGKIYIVGLGPGAIDDLTLGAVNRIHSGKKNFLRTERHPTVKYFKDEGIQYECFDYMYEEEGSFEDLYERIAERLILESSEEESINYFVPGSPMVAEKTVEILLKKDIDIEVISGMSFIEPITELVGRDPINGLKIVDGSNFNGTMVDINIDTIMTQVYNKRIMTEIKLILSDIYGDEYNIWVINAAGIEGKQKVHNIPIYLMDRINEIGYLTSIYIPKVNKENRKLYNFNDLIGIMQILRGENGCPWDMDQDHKSIRQCVIEEAYEVVDAIDKRDLDNLAEELGDLLLQVIFHSEIARDKGEFSLIDVTSILAEKLIYRHPHIFLGKEVENSQEVVYNWNKLKDSRRGLTRASEKMRNLSGLPALMKSYKIQEKAADIGFDWKEIQGPLDKVIEEYDEIIDAIGKHVKDHIEEEVGDLFFAAVNLARFLQVNPEVALNKANNKFIDRFEKMENQSNKTGKDLEKMPLDEMDLLWNLIKEDEN